MFRSVKDFEAQTGADAPRQVERDLIEKCRKGEALRLGGLPPEGEDKSREIRADLLRLLITGGTPKCGLHPIGIWLEGALVTGTLDLQFTKGRGRVVLDKCRFAGKPMLAQAEVAQLSLDGSHLPGLFAQGIRVEGNLFLRGLTATGTVDVTGARIIGQIACDGATLDGGNDKDGNQQRALNVQGAKIGGSLFLRGLTTTGTVHMTGARIAGQMDCKGAKLDGGEVKGGKQKIALTAQRLTVTEGFYFRNLKLITGQVNLDAAHVGDLADDLASWPIGEGEVYLNGFTYDRIGYGPETFAERRDWLARGSRHEGTFHPQPYTQFARVLREAGHEGEARKVLHERQKILNTEARKAVFARPQTRLWLWPFLPLLWLWRWITDLLLRAIVGYGFAPVRALVSTAVVVGLAAWFFSHAYAVGAMVPNSDVVLTSPSWWLAVLQSPDAPTLIWQDHHPAPHYETFYALAYAFDVFVPLVDLGQQSAWTGTTVTTLGFWARIGTMALEVAGWLVTALGAAAVTGIIQRDKD